MTGDSSGKMGGCLRVNRVAAVLCLMALASTSCGKDTRPISGRLSAPECAGGYEIENAEVELRNETNEIIGTGDTSTNLVDMFPTIGCIVEFEINEVPDAKFYSLAIGTHEGPNYSIEELERERWRVNLTLDNTEAAYPEPSTDEFCSAAEELDQHLQDLDMFNDQQNEWLSLLDAQVTTLIGHGAGWALGGDRERAEALGEALSVLATFREDYNDAPLFTPAARLLNDAVEPANGEMFTLMKPCDETWTNHAYVRD